MYYLSTAYDWIMGTPPKHKVLLVGDNAVGKTAWLTRFTTDQFQHLYTATDGYPSTTVSTQFTSGNIGFEVVECGGQQKFDHDWNTVCQGVDAVIIMFDLTNMRSFQSIKQYYDKIRGSEIVGPIVFVGNKVELNDHRQVKSTVMAEFLAEVRAVDSSVSLYEVSAKSNYNYEKPFLQLARQFYGDDTIEFAQTN